MHKNLINMANVNPLELVKVADPLPSSLPSLDQNMASRQQFLQQKYGIPFPDKCLNQHQWLMYYMLITTAIAQVIEWISVS